LGVEPKVLLYASSANRVPHREGGGHACGTWLSEITHPMRPLFEAGYAFSFATPDGRPCVIDERSQWRLEWGLSRKPLDAALDLIEQFNQRGFDTPMKISDVLAAKNPLDSCDALFIPGGHAPMTDVLHKNWFESNELNEETGQLLLHFHEAKKPTGLICHGTAVLCAAPYINGQWVYDGYNLTCVSMFEEWLIENLPFIRSGGHKAEYPRNILERQGAKVENAMLFKSLVVEDRELITAQDPFGGKELGQRFLKKVNDYVSLHATMRSTQSSPKVGSSGSRR
jgi:putative intracellular protease/amidase